MTCLHPLSQKEDRSVHAIGRIARLIPQVISQDKVSLVQDALRAYSHKDIPDTWYMKESDSGEKVYDRLDNYWAKLFGIKTTTGDKKFNLLARVVKSALCIHHGNADVERSLSDNKNTVTDERTRLSELTVNGLRLAKDFVHAHDGDVSKAMITKGMVQTGRNAHRTYKGRLDEEKEETEEKVKTCRHS